MTNMVNNPLNVSVGDVVEVVFNSISTDKIYTYLIEEVSLRYIMYDGTKRQGDLCKGKLLITQGGGGLDHEDPYFDVSYVTKIISRGNSDMVKKVNIFADDQNLLQYQSEWLPKGTNHLFILISKELAKLPYEIVRPLKEEFTLKYLYSKAGTPGLEGYYYPSKEYAPNIRYYNIGNGKAFAKWVRKNYTKFTMTVAECIENETREQKSAENDYWDELDRLDGLRILNDAPQEDSSYEDQDY